MRTYLHVSMSQDCHTRVHTRLQPSQVPRLVSVTPVPYTPPELLDDARPSYSAVYGTAPLGSGWRVTVRIAQLIGYRDAPPACCLSTHTFMDCEPPTRSGAEAPGTLDRGHGSCHNSS